MEESNKTDAGLMNLHNNEAGRRVSLKLVFELYSIKGRVYLNTIYFIIGFKITNATYL